MAWPPRAQAPVHGVLTVTLYLTDYGLAGNLWSGSPHFHFTSEKKAIQKALGLRSYKTQEQRWKSNPPNGQVLTFFNQRPLTREKCLTSLGWLSEPNSPKRVCHCPLRSLTPAAGPGGPGFSLRAWASRIQPMGEGCWADENAPDQWEEENVIKASWRRPMCYYLLGTYFERLRPEKSKMHFHIWAFCFPLKNWHRIYIT